MADKFDMDEFSELYSDHCNLCKVLLRNCQCFADNPNDGFPAPQGSFQQPTRPENELYMNTNQHTMDRYHGSIGPAQSPDYYHPTSHNNPPSNGFEPSQVSFPQFTDNGHYIDSNHPSMDNSHDFAALAQHTINQHQISTNNLGNTGTLQSPDSSYHQHVQFSNYHGPATSIANISNIDPALATRLPDLTSPQNATARNNGESATKESGKRRSNKCRTCKLQGKGCDRDTKPGGKCTKCIKRKFGKGELADLDAEQLKLVRCMSEDDNFDGQVR
jgi:hypothetical protein